MKRRPLLKNPYLRWGLVLLLAGFLAVYLAVDKAIMPGITRHNQEIMVPDLRGKTVKEALEEITSSGFALGDTTSRTGPDSLLEKIAGQNPLPNAFAKPGRKVALFIYRRGNPYVTVPDVIEQSLRSARVSLEAQGLVVYHEEPDTIPNPDPGAVTRILPVAGTQVQRGDSVRVWYGQGPDRSRLVTVPDVVGQHYLDARSALRTLSLWPSLLNQEEDNENPLIVCQSPESGRQLFAGETVRLNCERQQVPED